MENNTSPLFISIAGTAPAFYRCVLPATVLGYDWWGIYEGPPGVGITMAGSVENPDLDKYSHLILQQPNTPEWLDFIKQRQAQGQKIIYEIDDFVHGVNRIKGHTYQKAKQFSKKHIKNYNECMKACDALICSTDFLAEQYKKYNPNVFVCKVGIDTERYAEVEFGEHDHLAIGWAGGTGHHNAVGPWLQEITKILDLYKNVGFVSIGTRYAEAIQHIYPDQTLCAPWTTIENYPYILTNIDIAIAPGHESKYHLSKSDLRWLEASAMGIPTVCSPEIYPEADDFLIANNPTEAADIIMELIEDKSLREKLGKSEQAKVHKTRNIRTAAEQWINVLSAVAA